MCRAKQVWERGVNTWAGCYMSTDRYRLRSTRSMHTFEARRKITAALPYRANSSSLRIRQLMEMGKKCAGASATTSEMTAIAHTPFTPAFPLLLSFSSFPPPSIQLSFPDLSPANRTRTRRHRTFL